MSRLNEYLEMTSSNDNKKIIKDMKTLFERIYSKYYKHKTEDYDAGLKPRGVLVASRSGSIVLINNESMKMHGYPTYVNTGIQAGSNVNKDIISKMRAELEKGVIRIFEKYGIAYKLSKDSWSGGNSVISENRDSKAGLTISFSSYGGTNWTIFYITSYKQ